MSSTAKGHLPMDGDYGLWVSRMFRLVLVSDTIFCERLVTHWRKEAGERPEDTLLLLSISSPHCFFYVL